jgi:hypothetical protein
VSLPRFVTAVSRSGSRIHAVDRGDGRDHISMCNLLVTAAPRQRFEHTATETNCFLCCSRVEGRQKSEREG